MIKDKIEGTLLSYLGRNLLYFNCIFVCLYFSIGDENNLYASFINSI